MLTRLGVLGCGVLLGLGTVAMAQEPRFTTPEPRVPAFHRDMPEHAMTRAIRRAAEEAFRSPITDREGRVHYLVELAAEAANSYRGSPPPLPSTFRTGINPRCAASSRRSPRNTA